MSVTVTQRPGFTIIELMIATVVFSVILLIVTAGVLSFSKQFIKGQTNNQIQTSTTAAMNQVSQDAQFSHGFDDSNAGDTSGCYQIGTDLYAYTLGVQVSSSQHALVMAPVTAGLSCQSTTTANSLITATGARELLATNMRLLEFDISAATDASGQQVLGIGMRTAFGDNDLLRRSDGSNLLASGMTGTDWQGAHCAAGAGNQYCTTIELHTSVEQRL